MSSSFFFLDLELDVPFVVSSLPFVCILLLAPPFPSLKGLGYVLSLFFFWSSIGSYVF